MLVSSQKLRKGKWVDQRGTATHEGGNLPRWELGVSSVFIVVIADTSYSA